MWVGKLEAYFYDLVGNIPPAKLRNGPKYKSQQSRRNMKQACSDPWPSKQQDPCRFVIPDGISQARKPHVVYSPRTLGSSERNSSFLNVRPYNPVTKDRFWSETSGIRIPALPLTSYVTLGKQLCISVPQFPL